MLDLSRFFFLQPQSRRELSSARFQRFQELERSSFVSSDREGGLIASLLVLDLRYDGGSEINWAITINIYIYVYIYMYMYLIWYNIRIVFLFLASEHMKSLRRTWRYLEYSILLSIWYWGCQTASGSDRRDEAAEKTHAFPLALYVLCLCHSW